MLTTSLDQHAATETEAVCKECLGLNLNALSARIWNPVDANVDLPLPWSTSGIYGIPVTQLGHRYRMSADSQCVLCRLLAASRIKTGHDYEPGDDTNQDGADEILVVWFSDLARLDKKLDKRRAKKWEEHSQNKALCLILVPQGSL